MAIEIIAHRGFSARAPENTLSSFRLAWDHGATACETDIHLTSDGRIVAIHDKDTKRVANVKKIVAQSTLEELQTLDVGSWKGSKWSEERIPSLEQALATLPQGDERFFLEIKDGPQIVPALKNILDPLIRREKRIVLISFDFDAMVATKRAMPWATALLVAAGKDKQKKQREDLPQLITQAKKAELDGLFLGNDWDWNKDMVRQVHDTGLSIGVWTVDSPEEARRLVAMGLDRIATNDLVPIRDALSLDR